MICPVCGNIAEDNAKFCGNCGTNFNNIQSATQLNTEEDAVASFLSEMGENPAQQTVFDKITEQTEAVFQETQDRLFLDDDDEEEAMSDEAIVSKFFDNLDSIEEDAPMELSSEYKPEETQSKKIAPVFEEIPDEPIELPVEEMTMENTNEVENSFDDYSDIVMGDNKPDFNPVTPVIPVAQESIEEPQAIETSNVEENFVVPAPEITETNEKIEEPHLEAPEEFSDNEPHILIDERPDNEQNVENFSAISEYNINPETDGQTPYLDSFLQKPNFNVGFDAPDLNNVPQSELGINNIPMQNNNFGAETTNTVPVQPTTPVVPVQQFNAEPNAQAIYSTNAQPMQEIPMQQLPVQETQANKPPKKKKTGLIITLCVIGVLLVGIVASVFLLKDTIVSLFNPDIQIELPVDDNKDETDDNKNESNNNEDDNNMFIPGGNETDNNDETEGNETTEPTEPSDTTTPSNNPNWELKENSSLESPLIVGDATIVNRYIDDIKVYETLNLKLSKIYRGEESLNIAKQYEDGSTVRFEKPQDGIEYVVVEYEIYIPAESKTNGTLTNLPIEVRGLTTNGVIHNNKSYIISTWCVNDGGTTGADTIVKCQEIFQMPVGCNDYYIVFGTQGQNTATYKGE